MSQPSAELLLTHLGWVRTLAKSLVTDQALAEDVAQESCMAALRSQPREEGRTRAWLATIVRNFAHKARRSTQRRERLEHRAARAEATPATDTVLERAQSQQSVVAAVLALEEPYRTTILLRFFDDRKPKEIAALQAVPVATVDSRIQRALARLRERLDRSFGSRESWTLALAPLTATSAGKLALWAGIAGMNVKLKSALALVLLAGLATLWWQAEPGGLGSQRPHPVGATQNASAHGGPGGAESGGGNGIRTPVAASTRRSDTAFVARGLTTANGRVIDTNGRPMRDVEIEVVGSDASLPRARSTGDGAFAITVEQSKPAELVATDPRLVTVFAGVWAPDSALPAIVVVAPALKLGGHVRDEAGNGIAKCTLLVQLPEDLATRLGTKTEGSARRRVVTASAQDGGFALGRVPAIAGATIQALAEGWLPRSVPLPPVDDERMDLVLQPFHFEDGEVQGRVVDGSGAPVEGARVGMGLTSVLTDKRGHFALGLKRAGYPTELRAAKAGHLPARQALPREGGTKLEHWPKEIVLVLGSEPLAIRGRVVDSEGAPITGALVAIDDPEQLGIVGRVPIQLEYLLAGGAIPPAALRQSPHLENPMAEDNFMDQYSSVRDPDATWYYVKSDQDGRFELKGLLARDYRVHAIDPATAGSVTSGPIPAGSEGNVLTFTREGLWKQLTGRLLSLGGKPLAGVEVQHSTYTFQVDTRVPGGRLLGRYLLPGKKTKTDADGRFALTDVSKHNLTISFRSDSIVPRGIEAKDFDERGHCEVRIPARCHLEVALSDPRSADQIEALDANGEGVDLLLLERGSVNAQTDLPLHEGRSGVVALSEAARTLRLSKTGKVVRDVPLVLEPGKVFQVR